MKSLTTKKKDFKMPHTYVILSGLLILVSMLTHIIPSGHYDRVKDLATGKMVVVPGSFIFAPGKTPGFFDLFLNLQRGYVDAADIMFLIIFAYGFVYMLIKNGTLDAFLGALIKVMGDKIHWLIPISMLTFGLLSSTMGIYEEVYGLIPVFIGISLALGYDIVVGGSIVFIGVVTGFAASTLNPFSIGIAQGISGVPMFSGITYRIVIFIICEIVSISYVMWYAHKIKKDPTKSVVYGLELETLHMKDISELKNMKVTHRQKLCLFLFILTIASLLVGTTKWGWYINEIASMFLMMMIIVGLVGGYTPTQIAKTFIESTKTMVPSMFVVGFTRGILFIMKDAMISDAIVFYLVRFLEGQGKIFAAMGMLGLQNIIHIFITGSSSQATITMPIMAPTAELIGLSKQTAVLAYQFGNGFSNMFWPTACALECGLMGVPLNKWYKFVAPLFGITVILQIIFMIIAVMIKY
ncbi:MAG: YfcC family protein [Psychrilyobacter sp.]|uniref:YfcC family protein n=1 Tax=Psychrilyobacter sp. TaxID=2586924 RepID=UPI003C73758F